MSSPTVRSFHQLPNGSTFGPQQAKRFNKALADLLRLHCTSYFVADGVGFWRLRMGICVADPEREDVHQAHREFLELFGDMTGKDTTKAVAWLEDKKKQLEQKIIGEFYARGMVEA